MSDAPMVEVIGAKQLRKTMKAAGDNLADLKDIHQAAGAIVVARGQLLAPKRSGALAGTIRASRLAGGVAVKVGSAGTPYANPIHWGWPKRNIAASLFLTNAAAETEDQWVALYEAELNRLIDTIKGDS